MQISIIIVNYNSSKDLIGVVGQIENAVKLPKSFGKKIFVLENGSTNPGEWEALQLLKKYSDIDLSISEKNLGFTGGNNLLIEKAKTVNSDYFLLLNPDTVVDKNFIIELIRASQKDSAIGLLSPKIYFYKGFETHPERYKEQDLGKVIWYGGGIIDWSNIVGYHRQVDQIDLEVSQEIETTDFCTGCCMLVTKQAMEKLRSFDDKYFLNLEDLDLSVRAKKAGFRTVYVPKAIIWHKNALSKGGTGSSLEDFYQTRNRLIFAFKYASLKVKILLLWQLLRTANLSRLKAILAVFDGPAKFFPRNPG